MFRGVGTKNDEDALLVTKETTSSGGDGKNTIVAEKMMMTVSKLDLSDIGGKLNELKWQHVAGLVWRKSKRIRVRFTLRENGSHGNFV